jgi:hypothetical protein
MHILENNLFMAAAVIGLLLIVFVGFSIWSRKFGYEVVERWAHANNLQVVSVRRRAFVPVSQWRWLCSRQYQFFRVAVRDKAGANYAAWMRLESDCTEPKMIEVIWDNKNPLAA